MSSFLLDARLEGDTMPVGQLALCRLLLMNDRRWPWLILVPERQGIAEIYELSPADRALLVEEAAQAAEALKRLTGAETTNVATLGNAVRQFHLHVIARRAGDANWPRPVWGFGTSTPYEAGEANDLVATIRESFA